MLEREARTTATGRGGLWIIDLERCADQVVDKIDLAAGHVVQRDRIDQHRGARLLDDDVVVGAVARGVELVLKAGAAAALYADPQHGAGRLAAQNLANLARRPFGYGDIGRHELLLTPGIAAIAMALSG